MESDFITPLSLASFAPRYVCEFHFYGVLEYSHCHSIPPHDYMAILLIHLILDGPWDFFPFLSIKSIIEYEEYHILNMKTVHLPVCFVHLCPCFCRDVLGVGWLGKREACFRFHRYCQQFCKVVVWFSLFLLV